MIRELLVSSFLTYCMCVFCHNGEKCRNIETTTKFNLAEFGLIGSPSKPLLYQLINEVTYNIEWNFLPCEPWNSCVGRCDRKTNLLINYPPYTCYCDSLCTRYGDCCSDYLTHCLKMSKNETKYNEQTLQFSCVDVKQNRYGILMVDKCCANWTLDDTKENCTSQPIDPVTDSEGIAYKNGYCAICNGINKIDTLLHWVQKTNCVGKNCVVEYQEPSKFISRKCVYSVNNCSDEFPTNEFEDIVKKCHSYSGMVSGKINSQTINFKNAHCAICNFVSDISCPQWQWNYGVDSAVDATSPTTQNLWVNKLFMNNTPPADSLQIEVAGKEPSSSIPPAVSVLFNFGFNGKKNVYFSSNQGEEARNNEKCAKGQIWDPFLNVCRTLSCTAHFSLVDYQCVQSENASLNREELTDLVLGIDLNKVVVCMAFQMKKISNENVSDWNDVITQNLPDTLSQTLGINATRISNVELLNITAIKKHKRDVRDYENDCAALVTAFNCKSGQTAVVRFDLTEPAPGVEGFEPSIDRIMSLLITSVNLNTMFLVLGGFTLRLLGIHEETVVDDKEFQKWCADGTKQQYVNNEFTVLNGSIMDDDWKMNIFINETGDLYKKGEYLANFVIFGDYGDDNLASVTGIVVVCENKSKLIPETCPRLQLRDDEYYFTVNGSVQYVGAIPIGKTFLEKGEYEVGADGNLSICYNGSVSYFKTSFIVVYDIVQAWINLILTSISLLAMLITLITYSLFSKLRNLPGMNLMNLVFVLFLSQLLYLIGMSINVNRLMCKVFAVILHYEIIASFFWTNIMAYDLYKTFGNDNLLPFVRQKKTHLKIYMTYGYLSPAVIVAISLVIDTCKCTDYIFVGYGKYLCWIADPLANTVFVLLPIAVILVANSVFYIITIYSIVKITKKVKAATKKRGESDVYLYIKMSSVLGFTWIFGFAAQFASSCCENLTIVLTYIFVVCHSLQGLFICWAFVFNKRVYKLYKPYCEMMADSFKKVRLVKAVRGLKMSIGRSSGRSTDSQSVNSRSSSLATSRSQISDDYF